MLSSASTLSGLIDGHFSPFHGIFLWCAKSTLRSAFFSCFSIFFLVSILFSPLHLIILNVSVFLADISHCHSTVVLYLSPLSTLEYWILARNTRQGCVLLWIQDGACRQAWHSDRPQTCYLTSALFYLPSINSNFFFIWLYFPLFVLFLNCIFAALLSVWRPRNI